MKFSQIEILLEQYEAALAELEAAVPHPPPKKVLDVLTARDTVQAFIDRDNSVPSDRLMQLVELDDRLEIQRQWISQEVYLADFNQSLNTQGIQNQSWWWLFVRWRDRIWLGLSAVWLTVSISLVMDISSRFLTGGLGFFSSIAISGQSILTFLIGRNALTSGGQQTIERFLQYRNLPKSLWEEVRCGLTVVLLLALVGFRLLLPQIGVCYRHNGWRNYQQGDFASAESGYKKALSLNPDDEITHFYLGLLYEDLQELDKARTQYQMALRKDQGCDPIERCTVYNNLARLYILDGKDGKYKQAIVLLEQLESQLRESQLREKEKAELKYIRRKNLGWARLKLEQFASAKANLKFALDIAEQHPSKISQKKQASVH